MLGLVQEMYRARFCEEAEKNAAARRVGSEAKLAQSRLAQHKYRESLTGLVAPEGMVRAPRAIMATTASACA
jgi:hypothetical protein